jgi:4-amino-4-deoxy-L-arabinose transferase-like glycosyltransferase
VAAALRPAPSLRWAIAVGVALRLAFGLLYWTGQPLTHDEREYLALAANVAHGRGFTAELPDETTPGTVQRFGRAPGYPVALAPLTWLDADLRAGRLPPSVPAAVKIAQALLGGLGIALLAAIVGRGAGPRAAGAAAWIAALFPPLIWMPAYALSEQVYSIIALACAWWLAPSPSPRRASAPGTPIAPAPLVLAAIAAGCGALTRPVMLFFLPFAAVLLIAQAADRRTGLLRAAAFVAIAIATILPWTVRNLAVHERFVLIASEGGVTFWTGNHREAIGEGDLAANPHLKALNNAFRARHAGLSEEALEPLYYREALGFIRDDPGWWLGLEARKLWFTWVPFGPSYRLHSARYFWTSAIALLGILPFAVAGLWRAPSGTRPAALLALAASSVAVCLVFFPQERFRLPVVDPALVACAALLAAPRAGRGLV